MSEITDKIDELVVHLETAHATLVSAEQRIKELETALEPLKKVADALFSKRIDGVAVNENCSDDIELFVYADTIITFGDLRRARAALPPKITGGE